MTTPPPPDNAPDTPGWAPLDPPVQDFTLGPPAPSLGPPSGPEPPSAPVPARTDRLAIAALVTGLCGLVLFAIGFAIAALVRTGRRTDGRPAEKGRGLAIGGLAASAVWIAATVLAVAVLGRGPFSTGTESSASPPPDGYVLTSTLKVGDCLTALDDPAVPYVSPSPCNHPHNGEVIGKVTLPDAPFPGHQKLTEQAEKACKERIPAKLKDVDDLKTRMDVPDEKEWKDGDRGVTCILVAAINQALTTPFADLYNNPPPQSEPKRGDCVEEWVEPGPQPVVDCTVKHKYQVYAVYEMRKGKYPGETALLEMSAAECAKHALKVWGTRVPLHLVDPNAATPTKESWDAGYRKVFCLVIGKKGPLKRSVVPH
ncbi:DUF4190 domain-containing protein [Actinomadura sp. KC216]|uniref:DUF4190 domain-containing protein n=1 Tax=Actinomadura sp. KC216 TaxID=2530370 RepID=UPI0014043972|nr:DUF4190 domain-containing protein [Actinomadura sp. KC216]